MIKNEKVFTFVLILLAIAGISWYSFDQYKRINIVSEGFSTKLFAVHQKDFYIQPAKKFLLENNIDVADNLSSLSDYPAGISDSFLKRSIGEREGYLYRKQFNFPNNLISLRFFKELEKHESFVFLDPNTAKVRGFSQVIPENETRPNISKEDAQKMAEDFLTSQGIDLTNLESKDYLAQTIQNRVDQIFSYKVKGSELDTKYGQGYITYTVGILGNSVGAYSMDFFTPEDFTREIDKLMSVGDLLALLSTLVTALMAILGLVFTILAFRKGKINWKIYTLLFVILVISLLVSVITDYNALLSGYSTDQYLYVYFAMFIINTLIFVSMLNILIPLAGIGGSFLESSSRFKITNIKKNLVPSIYKGYLLAFMTLGFTTLIYYVGEKYLGVWQMGVVEPSNTFISYSVIFGVLYLCLSSSLSEEIIFRYFGFVLFNKYIKFTFLSMLLAVFVWAIGHSNYPVFPVYFRGIELVIGGMLWAYFILRYNIATTISAHFVYNAIFSCIGLYLSMNPVYIAYATIILLVPLAFGHIYKKLYL